MSSIYDDPSSSFGPAPPTYKHDHPATQPHVFRQMSKSMQSTISILDKMDREKWPAHSKPLSRKARRLRGTYATADITNHPHLSKRLTEDLSQPSRVAHMLKTNSNIVLNERGEARKA